MHKLPTVPTPPPRNAALLALDGSTWSRDDDLRDDMWVADTKIGGRWIVKARGGFRSYREYAFGRLAHHLGVSHQTSMLVVLSGDSLPLQHDSAIDRNQGAIEMLAKHPRDDCGPDCPLRSWAAIRNANDPADALATSWISNATDLVRSSYLADLCGANEPSDYIVTTDHRLVVIDSELMFASGPSSVTESCWLVAKDGARSATARSIAHELCQRFSQVTDVEIEHITAIPHGFALSPLWDVSSRIRAARDLANLYVRSAIFAPEA